ncbi:MAG: GAF domain-containing protein [Anaerolineae bacterium]|nr:GAF domain-containing protein [Anaerolineae bacterium]
MTDRARFTYSVLAGLSAFAVLVVITVASPSAFSDLSMVLFLAAMIVFSITYSVQLGGGVVSLMPMTVAAAYLTMGRVSALWTVFLGLLGQAGLRVLRGHRHPGLREPQGRALIERTAMNVGMHCFGLLAGAAVIEALDVEIPLLFLDSRVVARLLLGELAYLGVNYLLAAVYFTGLGGVALREYARSLPRLGLFEGLPILIAPLFPVVYAQLGFAYVVLFAASLAGASLISHGLSQAQQRLQRRVTELASLQAVVRALSSSLDVETVVAAIYEQVGNLMPVSSFYIALYDTSADEVAFPVVIEDGQRRLQVMTRPGRNGPTEHVIRTGEPLLMADSVAERVASLGLDHSGRLAQCWLGVPIKAGDEVLGALVVQSYVEAHVYDQSHLVILQMIATQAAVALQNARLYERTDEALARRVQELDSVLRTTDDGVLLMDLDFRVLAVNRALANLVGIAERDFGRHRIDVVRPGGEPLISLVHYTLEALVSDSERLRTEAADQIQDAVVFAPSGPHAERTLTPVRDKAGVITGWLLVFRDLTEELELQHLREDMIDMLVHDLRSPLSQVMASLSMLGDATEERDADQTDRLIGIAQRSSGRMFALVDTLLDISRLERGHLPLELESTSVDSLLREVSTRYLAAASANNIALRTETENDLPMVLVDRSLMGRVLSNLVDNALKFTQDGGEVTMKAEPGGEARPDQVVVSVVDTGPGIPLESRGQLFEKFQQVPNIRGRRRGTGLGLPFCTLVVEAHGGHIWVESEVGVGSSFFFSLPIGQSDYDASL